MKSSLFCCPVFTLRIAAIAVLFLLRVANCITTPPLSVGEAIADSGPVQKVLYVSPGGNDSWSGILPEANAAHTDGPLASIQAARDMIRSLKRDGQLAGPVTVYIRSGTYVLTEPLIFGPEDSGSQNFPITYTAYPREIPVISGGRSITGWKKSSSGELWETQVPGIKDKKWYFHQLFVNGARRQRARSPNKGFFYVDGELSEDKHADFHYRESDILPQWAARKNVEVVVLQSWTAIRAFIVGSNPSSRTVTLSQMQVGQKSWGREKNARYWIESAFEALDSPGEWYLDRDTGVLYYWPMPGEDMTQARVTAPAIRELVRFEGGIWGDEEPGRSGWMLYPVHDIRLVGLTFEYADWSMSAEGYTDKQGSFDVPAALEAVGANSITIEKNIFQRLGGYAVEFGKACNTNRIVRNDMRDLGAGGVKVGEPKVPNSVHEISENNIISDNRIHDIGNVYPATVGIWVGQSGGNTIAHNEIYDTYQTGIAVGWAWDFQPNAAINNVVEFNSVHDIGRGMLGDMGCIYTVGVGGGVIRNNVCHDVSRFEGSYGGWGIYLDQGSTSVTVENNLVYRTEDAGFHQNIANANMLRNNIFALGTKAELARQIHPDRSDRDWLTVEHNIVFWNGGGVLLDQEWGDSNFRFDNNLYYNPDPEQIRFGRFAFSEWKKEGQDVNSVIADPLFVDPAHGDFSLRPGSPAIKIGFQPLNLEDVGPTPEH